MAKPTIRGEIDEPFRDTLYRAFCLEVIGERELARRLNVSQAEAHRRLKGKASITEASLRAAATALGYRVQLTLVPDPSAEASQDAEASRELGGQLTMDFERQGGARPGPAAAASAKKRPKRRKDVTTPRRSTGPSR